MSIYENVAYGLRIHRINNSRNLKPIIRHYLEMAGLWDEVQKRLHDPATALSIGQQQRLCLARGLALEPEVILADEPTSALDPISSQHIEQKLQELKEKYTIVLVTHTLRQARRLADYVVYMYMGDVVEQGPAKEVFENPRAGTDQSIFAGFNRIKFYTRSFGFRIFIQVGKIGINYVTRKINDSFHVRIYKTIS